MESGLPALVIAALLMVSSVFVARGGFIGADAIAQSLRQSEARYQQQAQTDIEIESTSIDNAGANITAVLRSTGNTPVADFTHVDVVVQYYAEDGTRYDKWIAYTSGALASDTWKEGSFTNDSFEPGILNTDETMEVVIRVNPVVGRGTTNRLIIGSERGVTVQAYFAGPP